MNMLLHSLLHPNRQIAITQISFFLLKQHQPSVTTSNLTLPIVRPRRFDTIIPVETPRSPDPGSLWAQDSIMGH